MNCEVLCKSISRHLGCQAHFLLHSHPLAARPGNHPKYFFLGFTLKFHPFRKQSSQEQPGAARSSQEQPGAARSSQSGQEQPGAAGSSQEQPGPWFGQVSWSTAQTPPRRGFWSILGSTMWGGTSRRQNRARVSDHGFRVFMF